MFSNINILRIFLLLLKFVVAFAFLSCSDTTMTDPDPEPPFSFNSKLNPGDSAVDLPHVFLSSDYRFLRERF